MFEESVTYDDLLLRPLASEVLPGEVKVSSHLTKNIALGTPFLAAAMDTVSESKLAIALAQQGGVAIIHKNLSVPEQIREVEIVKRAANGVVNNPKTLSPQNTVQEAVALMKKYSVTSFPIVNEQRVVVGILTNRDLRFEEGLEKPVSSLMSKKVITIEAKANLKVIKAKFKKHKIEKLVITDSENRLKGLVCIRDILNDRNYPLSCKDGAGRLRVGAACGVSDQEKERAAALVENEVDVVVVDSAHGHHSNVIKMVQHLKKHHSVNVIGGNVATAEGCRALIDAGCDAVKVGIGGGSICTTRIVTGVGVPQATALIECVGVAKEKKIPIIADGGVKSSGDAVKALALGASAVMLGSLFAGSKEAPGETFFYNGIHYKSYRGMGSLAAMKLGSKERYLQEEEKKTDKLVPEGIEGAVPAKGSIQETLHQLVGGLRSAMGYVGARNLKELQQKANFIKLTKAGLQESHVHGILTTKQPPNYHAEKN